MSDININDMELIHSGCPNFKWYECWKSSTADRHLIVNETSDSALIENCRETVKNLLQPLRDDIGSIKPQSWYRCEELEKILCWPSFLRWQAKSPFTEIEEAWKIYFETKSHPSFQAVDIEVAAMSNDDLFYHIKKEFEFDQLLREFPKKGIPDSGWVHVSWAGANNRGQVKVIGGKM